MGKRIRGSNKMVYDCTLCGDKLTEKEYFTGEDMCFECSRKHYNRFNRDFTDRYGENKIDTILINKFRGKGI